MIFALAQLRKLLMPYSYEEDLDLSSDLDGFEDIVSSKPAHIKTTIRERGEDNYLCDFKIDIDLIMQDSISLKDIPYHIETSASEMFTLDETLEDAFLIEKQTLDTKEAILTNILCAKPMSITNEEHLKNEDEEPEEKEEYINPAFASLKDLL